MNLLKYVKILENKLRTYIEFMVKSHKLNVAIEKSHIFSLSVAFQNENYFLKCQCDTCTQLIDKVVRIAYHDLTSR